MHRTLRLIIIVGFMNVSNCILTDRLIVRPFVKGDEEDVLELMKDDYTARKAGFKPFKSVEEARSFIHSWRREGYAVTERSSDKVIGVIQAPIHYWDDKAFIGYWLGEQYRGKGYMTEAVEAVKEYVFNSTFIDEMELYVYCGNEASRNVALKCGFYPDYSRYKENVRSAYGTVESEERFTITRGDFEWEQRGCSTFSSAA